MTTFRVKGKSSEILEIQDYNTKFIVSLWDDGNITVMTIDKDKFKKFIKKVMSDAECGT